MANFLKYLQPLRLFSFGAIRFVAKHWYFFVLFLVLIPTIFSSVQTAIEEKNVAIPFVDLGLALANSDSQIAQDVVTLKENPIELIKMEKPTAGIWSGFKYKWKLFLVAFRELGLVWALFFPFVIIFKILRHRNQSESGKNIFLTIIYGAIFIFVINLIMIISGFVDGSLISTVTGDITKYESAKLIIIQALPFHGLVSLVQYLMTLAV